MLIAAIALTPGVYAEDLYIRDDINDTGIEQNPNNGPMWTSPDIWVRRDPLPGWNPYPYPSNSPPPWLDTTHFDPDYRSPLSGRPNYVYVRVRNRGTASAGVNERLMVYWAAASTGLSWDPAKVAGSFIDNVQAGVLHGSEITKPRENAATASAAERTAYINAIVDIADQFDPNVNFTNGDTYWHTQQEIHRFGPPWRHGTGNPFVPSVAFLPWHREFVNRYEGLLQATNPTLKLLYWQWTDQPETGPFNYFTNTFMGASGFGQPAGVQIGAPLSPATDGLYPNPFTGLNPILRRRQTTGTIQSDTTINNRVDYDSNTAANNFSGQLESISHNSSHVRVGGYWGPPSPPNPFAAGQAGDQVLQPYAARDPFFFMLHAKVDQLWARWQRKSNFNHDPATAYGTAQGDANIGAVMGPWDGVAMPDGLPNDTLGEIEPWTVAGGQINAKTGLDRSVVSPPFYDTAPLNIPAMQTNEEAILEIPWYPPDPANFGAAPLHACLVARIETSTSSPFGMTTAETADINANTRANNNIAWRNVSVVDIVPGPFFLVQFFATNIFQKVVNGGLRFAAKLDRPGDEFFKVGKVRVDLGPKLAARWREGGSRGRGFKLTEDPNVVLITTADATLENIAFQPAESFPVQVIFELNRDYKPTARGQHLNFDVVQIGAPGAPGAVVGGNRYQVAVEKLTLVRGGREWRLFGDKSAPEGWTGVDFDDSTWHRRRLELGLIDAAASGGSHGVKTTTSYLRHRFQVDDPSFIRSAILRVKQSDGAIAYLNGKEIFRANLPAADVNYRTLALKTVYGVAREAFTPVTLDPKLLREGTNVLAVEVHRSDNLLDLTFDAELNANWLEPREQPAAAFTNVNGELFNAEKSATVEVDAVDGDGSVRRVTLLVDGKPAGTAEAAPYRFDVPVRLGPQRLTALVDDDRGERTLVHTTITGVTNIPPKVAFTQPGMHSEITAGDTLVAVARASDPDGSISRVDFYLNDTIIFGDPPKLIASVTAEPYMVALKDLKPGHNMVRAVAYDNAGARTGAIPIMVIVRGGEGGHTTHSGH